MKNTQVIAIEYSKKNPELFNTWDIDRIKNAFNNGHGTIKDLKRYAKDNTKYCKVVLYASIFIFLVVSQVWL